LSAENDGALPSPDEPVVSRPVFLAEWNIGQFVAHPQQHSQHTGTRCVCTRGWMRAACACADWHKNCLPLLVQDDNSEAMLQDDNSQASLPLTGQGDMLEQSIEGRGAEGTGGEEGAEKGDASERPELRIPAGPTRSQ